MQQLNLGKWSDSTHVRLVEQKWHRFLSKQIDKAHSKGHIVQLSRLCSVSQTKKFGLLKSQCGSVNHGMGRDLPTLVTYLR